MKIHCIGNSHVNTFSNENYLHMNFNTDRFVSNHLGPVIAYNFMVNHMPKVREYISKVDGSEYITLCVGEVDCRLHLPKQADVQNITDEQMVIACVDRFFTCYVEISKTHNVLVTGTHPTTTEPHNMRDMSRPVYGDCARRNHICTIWNRELKQRAIDHNFKYISIYDYLVDDNNITKMEYFVDYCHLNSNAVFKFILEELKNEKIEL